MLIIQYFDRFSIQIKPFLCVFPRNKSIFDVMFQHVHIREIARKFDPNNAAPKSV